MRLHVEVVLFGGTGAFSPPFFFGSSDFGVVNAYAFAYQYRANDAEKTLSYLCFLYCQTFRKSLRPPGGGLIGTIALCSIVPALPRPITSCHVGAGMSFLGCEFICQWVQ